MEEAIKDQLDTYKIQSKGLDKQQTRKVHTLSIDQPVPVGSNGNFTLQTVLENKDSPQADEKFNASNYCCRNCKRYEYS